MDLPYYKEVLQQAGILFEPGLSQTEVQGIEEKYGFLFPPDLKDLLMFSLPISEPFLNWRHTEEEKIRRRMAWPYYGICFDIEHNSFWLEEWGVQPLTLTEAFAVAAKAVEAAPTLIPIYSHRYIPDRPNERGNPIYSVYQTDIIYYGCNLADYLENEFNEYFNQNKPRLNGEIKEIEFWSKIVS